MGSSWSGRRFVAVVPTAACGGVAQGFRALARIWTRYHQSTYEDRWIGGKEYRVIVEPISTSNPEGSTVALFLRHEAGWVRIGDDIVAGPGESNAELVARTWERAEYHSKVTSVVRE